MLHRAAYAALGLDWSYEAIEVTEEQLPALLARLDDTWAGLSLTMPLKQAVLAHLATASPLVTQVAAANTVLVRPGGLHGENTDVAGMLAALAGVGVTSVERAAVLGGGATARSALAALAALGCRDPLLVVRSEPGDTLAAAARIGVAPRLAGWQPGVLAGCELVVSTVPAGVADPFAAEVAGVPVLLDVVYAPWPTALAAACRGRVVSGGQMLLHQAAEQVRLMTGRAAPVAAMAEALKRAL